MRKNKILFTGGGTMGPVTPLLAVAEAWRAMDPKVEFVWVGTRNGPERGAIEEAGIRFLHIPVFRVPRYPTIEWLTLPVRFVASFVMAWLIIGRERPSLVASAGGYTGVPLAFMGKLRGARVWIHQQDARVLLANRVVAPFADAITVAWEPLVQKFSKRKTAWIGNPVRGSIAQGKKDRAFEVFNIDLRLPTVLVFGGGGGSLWLNQMMEESGAAIAEEANVIHITGRGKLTDRLRTLDGRYHAVEFVTHEMADAYAAADVVVSRAGMGTITELAACQKPSVLIPLPRSPQEANARILQDADAAVVLEQSLATVGDFKAAVLGLLEDAKKQKRFATNIGRVLPTDVSKRLVEHVKTACSLA